MNKQVKRYLLIIALGLSIALGGCGKEAGLESTTEAAAEESAVVSSEETLETEQEPEEPEAPEPVKPEEPEEISVVMVGDMLLHDRIEKYAKTEDGSYDYTSLFTYTKSDIESADLAIVNEEVIIGGEELGVSGYPAFNAPFEFADALADCGFDVICHATNHALDKGGKGILNCLSNWEENYPDIEVLGIHDSKDDQDNLYIFEKNGIRVAVLNYTYGTNGISLPSDMPYGVDYLSESAVTEDIKRAEEEADFTVVCPHWGTEYRLDPDSYQEKWAEIFVKNGVDLVLGTHPHVIEPVDLIEDEETGNRMLTFYSLGNYVNWTSGTGEGVSNRMLGLMAKVTLKKDEAGNTIIEEYDAVPLVSHVESGFGKITVYPLSDYTEELASKNEIVKQAPDFSYEYLCGLAESVLKENEPLTPSL
ncbi:MAG: CapA family protein [Lachnospiraceae bacterium]|nr:CapA family protein [Lachnospiraceae bacterium]